MIINNANLVTSWSSQPIVEGALIAIEGKTIIDFGKVGKLIDKYDDPEVLDAGGRLVVPGRIDAHSRPARSFVSGMPWGAVPPRSPREVRERHWQRLEEALDETTLYWSAVVSLLDAVRSGVTTVAAFNVSPAHVEGSLDAIERAFDDVGVRGSLAYGLSPRSDPGVAIRENRRYLDARGSAFGNELRRGLVGLDVSAALPDEALRASVETAGAGEPFHVVVTTEPQELEQSWSRFGCTPFERLRRAGVLERGGVLVLFGEIGDRSEVERLLKRDNLWLGHCPQSSILNATASPDLLRLASARVRLALGSDGLGGKIAEEFRLAALCERMKGRDFADAVRLASRAAIEGNADLATKLLGPQLGRIKPGARADLVILDYWPATPLRPENLAEHLFWGAAPAAVHSVIANGRALYHNGAFVGLDEERLRARAREAARALWERM